MKDTMEKMQKTIESMQKEYGDMERILRLEIETLKSEKLEQDIEMEKIRQNQLKRDKKDTDDGGGEHRYQRV